jgi:hypothetical protein
MCEVRDVGCDITAREVDEVEPIKHRESLPAARAAVLRDVERLREWLRTRPARHCGSRAGTTGFHDGSRKLYSWLPRQPPACPFLARVKT